MKLNVNKFLLLASFLLTSCGSYNGSRIFEQEKIKGEGIFADIIATVDKETKKVTISYNDITCQPSLIENISSDYVYTTSKIEKTWIGTSTSYTTNRYFFDVLLNEEDNNKICSEVRNLFDEEITRLESRGSYPHERSMLSSEIIGIMIGEEVDIVDNKWNKSFFRVYIKMVAGQYYNGNTRYRLAPEFSYND